MTLTRFQAHNFRRFAQFELRPHPQLNLLRGDNAAGKTTVLEALYALGRGRSFRATPAELRGTAQEPWVVNGTTDGDVELGVRWGPEGLQARLNRKDAALSALVQEIPVQVLEPDSHRLVEDGPAYRRRYLDWGVFHVEHQFYPAWRRYLRAMRQRNLALRAGAASSEVEAWNPELVQSGTAVQALRVAHLQRLRAVLAVEIERLLPGSAWTLDLHSGWTSNKTLEVAVAEHLEQDRRQGKTLCGPHRAELRLKLAGQSAKRRASRGQQKLLVAALLIAQSRLIAEHGGKAPILLVDDFPAELGPGFQAALADALKVYEGQVFLTTIGAVAAFESEANIGMFHVEHGTLSPA